MMGFYYIYQYFRNEHYKFYYDKSMVHPPLTMMFDKNDLPSHNNLLHVWLI